MAYQCPDTMMNIFKQRQTETEPCFLGAVSPRLIYRYRKKAWHEASGNTGMILK